MLWADDLGSCFSATSGIADTEVAKHLYEIKDELIMWGA